MNYQFRHWDRQMWHGKSDDAQDRLRLEGYLASVLAGAVAILGGHEQADGAQQAEEFSKWTESVVGEVHQHAAFSGNPIVLPSLDDWDWDWEALYRSGRSAQDVASDVFKKLNECGW